MHRQKPQPSTQPSMLIPNKLPIPPSEPKPAPVRPPRHRCRLNLTALPVSQAHPVRLQVILSNMKPAVVALLSATLTCCVATAQQSAKPQEEKSPASATAASAHDTHSHMNERGEKGMGFSQTANTHHFLLKPDGGVIQVEVNNPKDSSSRDSIRAHLRHVTHAFSAGDFDIPMFVHDSVPPGVPEMKRLKDRITYTFDPTPHGGRVRIVTSDPAALAAIHKFLRFQIEEHQTKDSTTGP
jgi:hypothetical protein